MHEGAEDNSSILDDDVVQPFQLEASGLRGRVVRMGPVLDGILQAHGYPDSVGGLLAETLGLCALLSSMLKYDGVFTLQAQGDGPVSMLVADVTAAGGMRGCAGFDADRVAASGAGEFLPGRGHMAFTVDPGGSAERYQGIVALDGSGLVASAQHYFTQSEQIDTAILLSAARFEGVWRAGGIMLQRMPEEGGTPAGNVEEDDWRRAMILMQSCTDGELLAPSVSPHALLVRLFHEEGVRVFTPQSLRAECRCSAERVENILKTMSEEDVRDMTVDGAITMTCEFCSREFVFDPADIARTIGEGEEGS